MLADADGDCEFDPGERWLAGVTIYLLDANGQRINSTTTNSEGRYEFTGLAPGVAGQAHPLQPRGGLLPCLGFRRAVAARPEGHIVQCR